LPIWIQPRLLADNDSDKKPASTNQNSPIIQLKPDYSILPNKRKKKQQQQQQQQNEMDEHHKQKNDTQIKKQKKKKAKI